MTLRESVVLAVLTVFTSTGLIVGCFSPSYHNGNTRCASDGKCPSGYHCAVDNTCWKNGQDPTPMGGDDMANPPAITFPPEAVWISSGGGSPAQGQSQLNLSIGGVSTVGTTASPGGATMTPGFLSNDTE